MKLGLTVTEVFDDILWLNQYESIASVDGVNELIQDSESSAKLKSSVI